MLCNVVLVSVVQQSESAVSIHVSPLLSLPSTHHGPPCRATQSPGLSTLCWSSFPPALYFPHGHAYLFMPPSQLLLRLLCRSVAKLCWALCDAMTKLTCPSLSPGVLLKLMSIESVMPSNHLVLCGPFSSCLQSFPASRPFLMRLMHICVNTQNLFSLFFDLLYFI